MKQYQALGNCVKIAVCVSVMMIGGCDQMKKHRTDTTVDAAINVMMMTNPMGSIYGKTSLTDDDGPRAQAASASASSGRGCPTIDLGLSLDFTPLPDISGSIDLTYNDDCIVHGLALSGAVMSTWSIEGDLLQGLELVSTITFDNLTVEGLRTDGSMYQRLYVEGLIPYLSITGDITTTHADGSTCSIVYDDLNATVDLANYTEFKTIFPGVTIVDRCSAALVINGSAIYTDEDDKTSAVTFENVKQPFGCIMPASGTMRLVDPLRGYDAIIDYGDGVCDTLITVTQKGQEPEVIDVVEWIKTHCDAECADQD